MISVCEWLIVPPMSPEGEVETHAYIWPQQRIHSHL